MSERAKLLSASVCPFGHFQRTRMPFGLKNAPLIYQSVINNCLWGFVRLPPEEEAEVDQDVLDFLVLTLMTLLMVREHGINFVRIYWPGMYADVEHFVKECVDCASGKERPPNAGPSPRNIEPRQPFEVVSMDFVTHMPKSDRGNTF
ncbi:hypothetical protein PHMEG_00040419 [Phytophthora megakarya]|uniref:Integrase zinc-binding domain-containing protein n=1 Tax=Phytophthora megakarya TaxID=4795 RepID=A0A225UDT3_9STRA|nr:hypothetical protein PHMEG_00040419 [Phytophthora megakarya]